MHQGKPVVLETPNEAAKPKLELPEVLVNAVRNQRAILFLGAGASREGRDKDGKSAPMADELKTMLCQKFLSRDLPGYSLMAAAEMLYGMVGQTTVLEYLANILREFYPTEAHAKIPTFRWRMIATTNYDLLIERAYSATKDRMQDLLPFLRDNEPIEERKQANPKGVEFLKLHGCIENIHDQAIPPILSPEQYERYLDNRSRLFSRLNDLAQEYPIIFCGYGLADPHIRSLIYRLDHKLRPPFYLVTPNATEIEVNFWAQQKVTVIKATMRSFMAAIDAQIPPASRVLQVTNAVIESPIRKFYKTNNSESSLLANFLERDVTHVHGAMKYADQDSKEFYRGLDTGWGFIFQNLDVRRKVTEEFLLAILDKIENPDPKPQLHVFKGPAGNGKSIALKRTAFETAALDQIVLWVNENSGLNPDALVELYELTGKQIFLFVDHVALHAGKIRKLIEATSKHSIPLTIVAAESDSEWYGYCGILEAAKPREHRVRYLSATEINGLLDRLREHNSLGILTEQSREAQFKAFHDNADRQLLVALHEATQGGRFEDIVFEEFKDILPEEARQLYLDVCTLNQFGVPVRAGTISRISGISFQKFNEEIFKPLQHIVFDILDPYTGDPQYKARHARVAAMAFRRACPTSEERADQLIRLAQEIDIGYAVDRQAYERLIKGHALSQMIDIHSGRRIYQTLADVNPTDAYLYQQWAIFESNDSQGSLADAQSYAEKARKLDPTGKTIIHTLAEISRKRANEDIPAILKESFRQQSRARLVEMKSPYDRFVVSTRAKILVDELEDLSKGDLDDTSPAIEKTKEIETLLENAQSIFSDPEFDEIEARFRRVLAQRDKFIFALKRAIDAGTTKAGLPVRLSKAYREKGDIHQAYETLKDALEKNPDNKMVHLAYAKMLLEDGEADKQHIIDHLIRSYDLADVNFEARYVHAQVLYAIGEKVDAAKMFTEIDTNAPEHFQNRASPQHSHVSKYLTRQIGKITLRTESLIFLNSPGYPAKILVPEDKSEFKTWNDLEVGTEVEFDVLFNRKGPVAINITTR